MFWTVCGCSMAVLLVALTSVAHEKLKRHRIYKLHQFHVRRHKLQSLRARWEKRGYKAGLREGRAWASGFRNSRRVSAN